MSPALHGLSARSRIRRSRERATRSSVSLAAGTVRHPSSAARTHMCRPRAPSGPAPAGATVGAPSRNARFSRRGNASHLLRRRIEVTRKERPDRGALRGCANGWGRCRSTHRPWPSCIFSSRLRVGESQLALQSCSAPIAPVMDRRRRETCPARKKLYSKRKACWPTLVKATLHGVRQPLRTDSRSRYGAGRTIASHKLGWST
jgi:hypothetical protein